MSDLKTFDGLGITGFAFKPPIRGKGTLLLFSFQP